MSSQPKAELKLYGYWRSSASWRVRWGLELKKLPFTYVPVNILSGENKKSEHLARNPMGALPVLDTGRGVLLSESLAILEYLEEEYKGYALYPGSALDRAQVRALCEIVNSGIAPLQTPRAQNRHSSNADEKSAWAQDFIRQGLQVYDRLSSSERGAYSFRDQVTAADLCLVPQVYNARRYGIEMAKDFPKLHEIYERCMQTPECRKAAPESQSDAVKS